MRLTSEAHLHLEPHSSESYSEWLLDWMSHISDTLIAVLVPPESDNITSPFNHGRWQLYLSDHPDAALTEFFIMGIIQGFWLGFNSTLSSLKPVCKNLDGALQHPLVVDEYNTAEIIQHRVINPLPKKTVSMAYISCFKVIPKCHTPNLWRLIITLFHQAGHSMNDSIINSLWSLSYVMVDTTIWLSLTWDLGHYWQTLWSKWIQQHATIILLPSKRSVRIWVFLLP